MNVHITSIAGYDGNCLFRALSHAITRSESAHDIVRAYQMGEPGIEKNLKQIFSN